jgi:zinc transport system ATP-binding protein
MAQIICENVAFEYDGRAVSKKISFTVNSGDYLCIVGENGSGKSTLIKGLLRLKAPSSGQITYGDGLMPTEIGYLPQQTVSQKDFPASVYEVVLSGKLNSLGFMPFYSKKMKNEALENMRLMGIENLKNRCYQELSGGQQQRVLLARALCATKKMLLLDEPVAGLDPKVTDDMYTLIDHINKKMEITVIMVSHDIQSSVKYASHILHLGNSQFFFGSSSDYMKSDLCKSFMGSQFKTVKIHPADKCEICRLKNLGGKFFND